MKKQTYSLTLAAAALLTAALFAQTSAIKRTIVERGDVASVPNREAIIADVEIAPGGSAGRHTHPGEEISYIKEGTGQLLIDGKPPRNLKAGEGFIVPSGAIHDFHNTGSTPLKLVGIYLVEKGKPLATPAP